MANEPDLVEYREGTAFPGTIGKTIDDSKEAWPVPKKSAPDAPNVTGMVKQVKFDLSGDAIKDEEAHGRHAMSKQ